MNRSIPRSGAEERFAVSAVPVESLLTQAEVAALLAIRPRAVTRLGIPAVRLGHRTIRYRRSDLEAFIAARLEHA